MNNAIGAGLKKKKKRVENANAGGRGRANQTDAKPKKIRRSLMTLIARD